MRGRGGRKSNARSVVTPLVWKEVAPRLRRAMRPAGCYVMVANNLGEWTAAWHPEKGRQRSLAHRVDEAHARTACQRHHVELCTSALLPPELSRPDLLGPAIASRFRH